MTGDPSPAGTAANAAKENCQEGHTASFTDDENHSQQNDEVVSIASTQTVADGLEYHTPSRRPIMIRPNTTTVVTAPTTLSMHSMAWDIPPIVASPHTVINNGEHLQDQKRQREQQQQQQQQQEQPEGRPFWKARSCRPMTPQYLSSILLLTHPPRKNYKHTSVDTTNVPKNNSQDFNSTSSPQITILNENDEDKDGGGDGTNTERDYYSQRDIPSNNSNENSNNDNNSQEESSNTNKQQMNRDDDYSSKGVDVASTTACSCPPMLWKGKYLVLALMSGEIRVYGNLLGTESNFDKEHSTTENGMDPHPLSSLNTAPPSPSTPITRDTPMATLSLPSDATIIQVIPMETEIEEENINNHKDNSTDDDDNLSQLFLALSVEGHVHQIRIVAENNNEAQSGASSNNYSLELEHSWNTGNCGATCMVVTFESDSKPTTITTNDATDGIATGRTGKRSNTDYYQRWLLIGYSSGLVECWKLMLTARPPTMRRRSAAPRRNRPDCLWKGLVEEPYSVLSMQILQSPSPITRHETTIAPSTNNKESPETSNQDQNPDPLLVATLQTPIGDDPPILQVLDLMTIQRKAASWKKQRARQTDENDEDDDSTVTTMALSPFRLLPDPAMGLVELSTAKSSKTSTISLLPTTDDSQNDSSNTTRLYLPTKMNSILVPSGGTNTSMSLNSKQKCGVAMSNGMVAILSPGWGIASDADQLLFSYPAIGMGHIKLNGNSKDYYKDDKPQDYLVCCLRAGTCYLIPITEDSTIPPEIPVITYPHDIDADVTSIYVQHFTAGVLQRAGTNNDEESPTSVPVLVYVLPGGAIDIYSIGLLPTKQPALVPSTEDQLLQELIQQGCLTMLLDAMDRDVGAPEGLPENWERAKAELQSLEQSSLKSVEDLNATPTVRQLLLQLASVEEQ